MKAVILAGGYGTRFVRDLEAREDGKYAHLIGVPKPLLPVGGAPLITHWVHILEACPQVSDIYVVVNAKYFDQFDSWSKEFTTVQLVCDGTHSNEERLGAVACIQVAVAHFAIEEDIIVIGGDTLFLEDFILSEFIGKFLSSPAQKVEGALVLCYQCTDEDTRKLGIVEMNEQGKITSFLEKPSPSATQSRLACPCFYILSKGSLKLLSQFLEETEDCPLKERDATGHFVRYLCEKRPVYTSIISGRFDVGGLQSYIECCELYRPPLNH